MLNAALELLDYGLSVVPLVPKIKSPPKDCTWLEQQDVLPKEGLIVSRFDKYKNCNLGVITGLASQLVVIEGDNKDACEWIEKTFPATWLTVSNNGRGRHYYYRYPKLPEGSKVVTSGSRIHDKVDVRGHGGLIVVPPSIHYKSKNKYVWHIADTGEGFGLETLDKLPVCPVNIPRLIDGIYISKGKVENGNNKYPLVDIKNIVDKCKWLKHCWEDTAEIKYYEWLCMLRIVCRCEDGLEKAHKLSQGHLKYTVQGTDKKFIEAQKMGTACCKEISGYFEGCFSCKNLGRGLVFSPVQLGEEEVVEPVKLITIDDIVRLKDHFDFGIEMPEEIINPGGLISKGMEALREANIPNIPQFSFPIVMATIGRAISGKIAFKDKWPNFFNIKVGGTSTGKTESDRVMKKAVRDSGLKKFYGPTDFSSGPGLLRSVSERPKCLINIDEASYMFKRFGKNDQIAAGKRQALLELFSSSGEMFYKTYSNIKDSIKIDLPCVNIVGNATPTIFDDIQNEDFETGILQRFDFWYYTGKILKRKIKYNTSNLFMDDFITWIKKLFNSINPFLEGLEKVIPQHYDVLPDEACEKRLQEFSDYTVDHSNLAENNGDTGIASRIFDTSIKYALCHMASDRSVKDIYSHMTLIDIEYGIKVASLISNWKLRVLNKIITQGDFHQNCQLFQAAILGAIKIKKRPTLKILLNRRKQLKNLKTRELNEIIDVLNARGVIFIDESKKTIAYWLIEQDE